MLVVIASVLVCLIFASLALARRDATTYPSNVWAGGVAIGGLNQEEALSALTDGAKAINNLDLRLPDKNLSIPLKELGIQYDCQATLAAVDKSLYDGKGLLSLLRHSIVRGDRQVIAPVFQWNARVLKEKLLEIKKKNDKPALDARILYSNSYIEYVSHSNGYSIDIDQSTNQIIQALQQGSLAELSLSINETHPRVKLDDIKELKGVIGLNVVFLPGNPNQYTPALQSINGLIVMPDDSIDMRSLADHRFSSPIAEGLRTACSQAGLKDKGELIYNHLDQPILITCIMDDNSLIIRIFSCRA